MLFDNGSFFLRFQKLLSFRVGGIQAIPNFVKLWRFYKRQIFQYKSDTTSGTKQS
jgi:hypothetical protein